MPIRCSSTVLYHLLVNNNIIDVKLIDAFKIGVQRRPRMRSQPTPRNGETATAVPRAAAAVGRLLRYRLPAEVRRPDKKAVFPSMYRTARLLRPLRHSRSIVTGLKHVGVTAPRSSKAIIHGDTVYCAGMVGDPEKDIHGQTQDCLDQLDQVFSVLTIVFL